MFVVKQLLQQTFESGCPAFKSCCCTSPPKSQEVKPEPEAELPKKMDEK